MRIIGLQYESSEHFANGRKTMRIIGRQYEWPDICTNDRMTVRMIGAPSYRLGNWRFWVMVISTQIFVLVCKIYISSTNQIIHSLCVFLLIHNDLPIFLINVCDVRRVLFRACLCMSLGQYLALALAISIDFLSTVFSFLFLMVIMILPETCKSCW